MKEGQTGQNPDKNNGILLDLKIRVDHALYAGVLGTFFGGISYGVSRLLTAQENAVKWGLGIGGGFASAGLGATWSNLSMEKAEYYLAQDKKGKARFKVAQAVLEGALGIGGAAAIPGIETGNFNLATIGGIGGMVFGGISSFLIFRERIKSFPELITPAGIQRDASFPDSIEGKKFPPVYRASTLKDLIEFRGVNKERIIKWAGDVPAESIDPHSLSTSRLITSVFIIPDLQHFPAYDPEGETQDMKLVEGKDNIVVHPDKHSFQAWPYQTCFEIKFGESTYFQDKFWQEWRERSWKHGVVLLAQYQTKNSFGTPSPEQISDRYWLLDIISDDGGQRRRVPRKIPQGAPSPVFNPQ